MTQNYISIDLETTGLSPKLDKIIEIGAVKVHNGEIVDTFTSFINPGRKLSDKIVELTGIHDEDLAEASYIEEILPWLDEFMEDLPILGHSVMFDYKFLKKAALDNRRTFEKNAIDTLMIARKYLAELEHRNLDYLCNYYQIEHHAHRALEDAKATHYLYKKFLDLFYEKECAEHTGEKNLFVPKKLTAELKRDIPATKHQKNLIYHLIRQHNIILDLDVERMTKSEASRLENQIRTGQFGMISPEDGAK
ncbi:MAG: 3'-5' exoribonuclease [Lachnospiraceae bacterium]|nr:3'-5' exoribonuclease [Lachnospiraceae bacterium]